MNPRPLQRLFSSPRQLLEKAKRDCDRLYTATWSGNETVCGDAMLDAATAVYQVKDWIGVMHPGYKDRAEEYAHTSKWILICRDICTASKHVGLDLKHKTFAQAPQAANRVDATLGASTGAYGDLYVLKVHSDLHGDHYAPDVIRAAIEDWGAFLMTTKIP